MPREIALFFPPSFHPPALADDAGSVGRAAAELGWSAERIAALRPVRVSFDARPRQRGWRIVLAAYERGEALPPVPASTPPTFERPAPGAPRVVVIGSGPAGLFAALDLLAAGLNVSVLERGHDVRARRRSIRRLLRGEPADPDCNYCFGEGGAGTYSDGKLYTRSKDRSGVRAVLETLVAHGAPSEVLVSWRPHVGSNRLPEVVAALRETILRSGGEMRFGTRAEELVTAAHAAGPPRVRAVLARDLGTDRLERFECAAVVLAAGHSALDSLLLALHAGALLEAKGFAMGVRAEHPQPWLDQRQYGGMRGPCDLPASFYELAEQVEGRGVYSFCMCPGGFIVPAATASERVVVNGMSLSRRDSPYANSGIVVAIEPEDWCGARGESWGWTELLERARAGAARPELFPADLPRRPQDDPLLGVRLQLALESLAARLGGGGNRAPAQRADHAAQGEERPLDLNATSYRPGLGACTLSALLPTGMHARIRRALVEFDRRIPGFASELGQLVGVESRTSSPVRIVRDPETLEARGVGGLYPVGEGAGYAGGIVSAALDGRRAAAAAARALAR